jgi:hypothetical protein
MSLSFQEKMLKISFESIFINDFNKLKKKLDRFDEYNIINSKFRSLCRNFTEKLNLNYDSKFKLNSLGINLKNKDIIETKQLLSKKNHLNNNSAKKKNLKNTKIVSLECIPFTDRNKFDDLNNLLVGNYFLSKEEILKKSPQRSKVLKKNQNNPVSNNTYVNNTKYKNYYNDSNEKKGAVQKLIKHFENKLAYGLQASGLVDMSTIKKRKKKLSASKIKTKIKSMKKIETFLSNQNNNNVINRSPANFKFHKENRSLILEKINFITNENKENIANSLISIENKTFGSTCTLLSTSSTMQSTDSLCSTSFAENDSSIVYSDILITNLLANDEIDEDDDFPEWAKDETSIKLSVKQFENALNYTCLFRSCNFDEMGIRKIFNKVY